MVQNNQFKKDLDCAFVCLRRIFHGAISFLYFSCIAVFRSSSRKSRLRKRLRRKHKIYMMPDKTPDENGNDIEMKNFSQRATTPEESHRATTPRESVYVSECQISTL